ncbi:hypothetical protein SAMN05443245_6896 [Paraburkholderia fungorum]|uniref:Uncharacterized protein n=2 Tax=Paraburkholderia fungorum TaxID=134537 RepID=A0A1H1JN27_9BURK|nr:hypothetical protein SAMN05443245_6896 [Paraburkholderia fungorum]
MDSYGSIPYNLDGQARAELLAYLVVSQLIARARTGEWLVSQHLGESVLLWLCANGANCPARERAALSKLSVMVAIEFLQKPECNDETWLNQLFAGSWRIDYRRPSAPTLHKVCVDKLAKQGLADGP